MNQPKASNQVSLWRKGCWVGSGWRYPDWSVEAIMASVFVVDAAILKMMGKDDG